MVFQARKRAGVYNHISVVTPGAYEYCRFIALHGLESQGLVDTTVCSGQNITAPCCCFS